MMFLFKNQKKFNQDGISSNLEKEQIRSYGND
jgi:hypothetical protein